MTPMHRFTSGSQAERSTPVTTRIDRHCEAGRGDQAALIYDSPVTGQVRTYSYDELLDEVSRFAGALKPVAWVRATGSLFTCR